MKVKHFTTVNYVQLSLDSTIREALSAFLHHQVDIGCVTDQNQLLGIVHKYSIYRALLNESSLDDGIEPLMKTRVITIHKDQTLYEARDKMMEGNVSQAVVLDHQEKVFGIMSKSDLVTSHMTALEHTINRMTSLIENLQESVISVDSALNVTAYNQTALKLLKIEQQDLHPEHIIRLFPDLGKKLSEAIRTGTIIDAKRMTIYNQTVIASFIPIRELNRVSGAMVVLRDVTSYEKIADELETTTHLKQLLDSALELAYDAVIITDNHGKITRTNQGFLNLYQIQTKEEVLGKALSAIAPEIHANQTLKNKEKVEGELIEINRKKCIATSMPIYQNGQKIGAIFKIIFQQLDTWRDILLHMEKLESEVSFYRKELMRMSKKSNPFTPIITSNDQMNKVKEEAMIASKSFSNILITGESGTGKELFAEGIHHHSGRKGSFIKVNCAAIPEELLESEFFGYVDGAFTGAKKGGKPGKFELAHKGTLFLDEIGDMPLTLQTKLLRVLQEQEFEKIGATQPTKVDVRILAATNKDLAKLVRNGDFREDLFYRIHVIRLKIPPLREHLDDIPLLCKHFITKINAKTNKTIAGVSPDVIQKFEQYHWPGNIRELENVLERAVHFCPSNWIEPHHLPDELNVLEANQDSQPKPDQPKFDLADKRNKSVHSSEKQAILKALKECGGNRTRTAQLLGVSRTTLYKKLKQYNIQQTLDFTSMS
ncbi:sigma-54-dependent Fis family transcriptional regulator [Virgibacillus sp. MSP4-1]|uniref:sigma-54-dependent Fis family transcriptional regulator n=1 Tax=Virgibacillus sp. MSP4-1 TaxID=2700081 RepID=UPI0005C71200|nr:sigma-54-dependent Fis family transcriptional regulator [Virgibacillus sp. MSP4-1]QHS21969.1 sigma-54-dependent Fis family transcriptional regulator [Virgibacillus sp. MSP4-1]